MAALARAGIDWDERFLIESPGSRAQGYRDVAELLRRRLDFTAVVCQNDEHSLGVMERLLEAGLRIPRDVSIVGFDGIAAAADYPVPLTTCGAELKRLARESLALLLGSSEPGGACRSLEPRLQIRASTGPAPAQPIRTKIRKNG
jgi:LacI family transcriptional regulator